MRISNRSIKNNDSKSLGLLQYGSGRELKSTKIPTPWVKSSSLHDDGQNSGKSVRQISGSGIAKSTCSPNPTSSPIMTNDPTYLSILLGEPHESLKSRVDGTTEIDKRKSASHEEENPSLCHAKLHTPL